MGNRLQTGLGLTERKAAIYAGDEIAVPVGDTRLKVRISRPNSLKGEMALPDRGKGGRPIKIALDRKSGHHMSGLDTEVVRAVIFFSADAGRTWRSLGGHASLGGALFTKRGDLVLESWSEHPLPEPLNPDRRVHVVLDLAERLTTQVEIETDDFAWSLIQGFDLHRSIAVEDVKAASAGSASTVSTANATPAGSNRFLVITGGSSDYPTVGGYSSMTFGAASATQIFSDNAGLHRISAAGIVAPSTTPAACSYTITNADSYIRVVGLAFSGVDQTTPNDSPPAASTGTSTTPSATISAGDSGDVRLAVMWIGTASLTTLTTGSGETERDNYLFSGGAYSAMTGVSTKEDGGADAMNWTANTSADWIVRGFNINIAAATFTRDQQAFAIGMDDGAESAYTLGTQNTNATVALGVNAIVRNQLQATGDPSSAAYALYYQKNGSGGYVAVPVGATTTYGVPAWKSSGTPVAGTGAITVGMPSSFAAGDLLGMIVESANQAVATPPSGWTEDANSPQGTGTAGGTAATRLTLYWKIATGSETGINIGDAGDHTYGVTFAISGTHQTLATAIHQSAGDVASSASTSVTWPAVTTTVPNCLILNICANATDTATAQMSGEANASLASVTERIDTSTASGNGGGLTVVSGTLASAGASGSTTGTLATSSVQGRITVAIRPPADVTNEIYINASAHMSNGDATTQRMSGGTGSFDAGQVMTTANSATTDIGNNDNTEQAYCVRMQSPAAAGDYYDLRTYVGGVALDSYSQTGRLTVAGSGNTIAVPAGSLSLTGFAPTIVVTANNVIAVPVGSLALSGKVPTVIATANNTIAVPLGSLALTGEVPTIVQSANQLIAVPLATLTLTAQTPTVTATAGNYITVPAGSLTLNGLTPTVVTTENNLIAVPLGTLSLTALVPTIQNGANHVIDVPAGSLSLTGYAPDIVQTANQVIAVPAGNLLLTGLAPDVALSDNQIVPVPLAALTLTGFAPNVDTGGPQLIDVPLAVLTLTAYAPTVIAPPPNGGGGPDPEYWYWLEKAREQLRIIREREAEIAAEVSDIPDAQDRETAQLIRQGAVREVQRKVLANIQTFADQRPPGITPRMTKLLRQAADKRTEASLARLQVEMARAVEDEEAIVVALLMLD